MSDSNLGSALKLIGVVGFLLLVYFFEGVAGLLLGLLVLIALWHAVGISLGQNRPYPAGLVLLACSIPLLFLGLDTLWVGLVGLGYFVHGLCLSILGAAGVDRLAL